MTLIKFSMFSSGKSKPEEATDIRRKIGDKRPSFALPSVDSAVLRAAVVGGCTQSALPFSTMASSGPSAPRNKQR